MRSPASRPMNALPSTSTALARTRSSEARTAAISVCPMRPPAPAMATFSATIRSVVVLRRTTRRSKSALQRIPHAPEEAFVIRRRLALHRFFAGGAIQLDHRLRHLVAFPPRELVVVEIGGELPMLAHLSLLRVLVDIVPAAFAERARHERRTEHTADLLLRHADFQLV